MKVQRVLLLLLSLAVGLGFYTFGWSDPNEDYEKAIYAVLKKIGPSVVQINTQGGTDIVVTGPKGPAFRKALGPTTGVVVSADGYIISSAFNFINNPTTILVEIPGDQKKYIAKKLGTDKSRMLTLLKVDAANLKVPEFLAKKDLKVGQTSLALGRTLDTDEANPPSVSFGIISALGRVWGKCIQTDAKTSPVNYGGPLVDILGRVQGIVVPASPKGDGETAGFEWYDSGIGFAIPMEDVQAIIPKLKKGADLKPGILGVQFGSQDLFSAPVVTVVAPDTAAAKAGLKAGDKITELDGHKIKIMAQIKHALGPKYEGDSISIKYERGGKEEAVAKLELVGKMTAYANSFMGILPMRDDPKLGVEIRYVYPGSPADKAKLQAGDRIVKYGDKDVKAFEGKVRGRNELMSFLNGQRPGSEIKLEVQRKGGKAETVSVKLIEMPGVSLDEKDTPPDKLPPKASYKKALDPLEQPGKPNPEPAKGEKKEIPTGLQKITAAGGNQTYWMYVHEDYDPNIAQVLLVWLHPPGKSAEKDMETLIGGWDNFCKEHNILILAPIASSEEGWVPSDAPAIQEVIRDALSRYTVDQKRVIAHGLGVGGQMAIHLGFNARDLVNGVATTGAVPSGIEANLPSQRLAFFLTAGDRDPLVKAIAQGHSKLVDQKIPVIYREMKNVGRQYLDAPTLQELIRWIEALDRL